MIIYPAIDLYEEQAVRLLKGDYSNKTVYSDKPLNVALNFALCGATHIHLVDLEGAKNGNTPNFDEVCKIKNTVGLFCEIGGGIRSMETVEKYLYSGIDRVILGTAAVNDRRFLEKAANKYSSRLAVGVDIKDGYVCVNGWTEKSEIHYSEFIPYLEKIGITNIIVTDISKDGAMKGTNRELYKELQSKYDISVTASGGVSTMDDIIELRRMRLHGAIIGKAYYTGAISLKEAIDKAK